MLFLKCNLKIKRLCIVPVDIKRNSTMPFQLFTLQISIPFKYYRQEKSTFLNLHCSKIPRVFGLTSGLLRGLRWRKQIKAQRQ
jgi:hypothetical protein